MNFQHLLRHSIGVLAVLLLSPFYAAAADRVTASVYVTNTAGTTNGQTIVINGSTRTWTNSVFVPSIQILTNSTAAGAKTNLFNQIALNPVASLSLIDVASTNFQIVGASGVALTVTPSAGWAAVFYSTQSVVSMRTFRVPVSGETATIQIANGSDAVKGLNDYSTNGFYENSLAMTNMVGRTNAQTISGAKGFTNALGDWRGGITNTPGIIGTVVAVTNGHWQSGALTSPTITNGTTWGTATMEGSLDISGSLTFQGGASSIAAVSGGYFTFQPESASAVIIGASTLFGSQSGIEAEGGRFTNNVSIGTLWPTNTDNQGPQTFMATNTFNGAVAFTRKANTSLATGNNAALDISTNVFVQVSGPGAGFSVNGIAGGFDGRYLIILNRTGFAMTVENDSGVDPTAANRIYTLTGAASATTGDGCATFIYSAADSRWILVSIQP